tara:strand:- start:425493 stop:425651 length:159 start_codon:yes stop_codon:yes gene_type:complete
MTEPRLVSTTPEDMKQLARDAIAEYNAAYAAGGEIAYPQWAADILKQEQLLG